MNNFNITEKRSAKEINIKVKHKRKNKREKIIT
jgi:hypothetical protein